MRQIKFRGKTKVTGKWICGDIAHLYGDVHIQTDISDNDRRGTIGWDVDVDTIGQFTGIVDRNGTEIYEGDIIRAYDSNGKPVLHEVYYFNKEARFATKLIGYENLNEGLLIQKWINELDFEIIGNIFDNPELLKKEK